MEKKKFTFADKELIWDTKLWDYFLFNFTKIFFPLINVDDLTELAYQLDENDWKDPEKVKKFGLDSVPSKFLDWEPYLVLDNLSNQILARCTIVADRLTHGIDKKNEEKIMSLAFGFQKCYEMSKPKANEEVLKQKVQQVLSGDQELLKRLQDLPYLNPEYKLTE